MEINPGDLQVGFLPEWLVHELADSYIQVFDEFLTGVQAGNHGSDLLYLIARRFADVTRQQTIPALKKYRERGF